MTTVTQEPPPYPLAPWAEIVPPMTVADLESLPDDAGWVYELVEGVLLPPRTSPEYRKALPLAPDLAVAVASEFQYQPGLDEKARRYLRFGSRLVSVIWPRHQTVEVWHPGDTEPATRTIDDTLDGEDVVPGFRYPIASLFA